MHNSPGFTEIFKVGYEQFVESGPKMAPPAHINYILKLILEHHSEINPYLSTNKNLILVCWFVWFFLIHYYWYLSVAIHGKRNAVQFLLTLLLDQPDN